MDAIDKLKPHINVEKILEHYNFDEIVNDNEMIRCCCKIHDGNNPTAFVIDTETTLWYCHTNCGGGDIYTLIQKMEGCDFHSAVKWIADFFKIDINSLQIKERQDNYLKDAKKFISLMRKKRNTSNFVEYKIEEDVKKVNKFRDFKESTLQHFGLCYVDEIILQKRNGDDYMLTKRLVFPIVFKEVQIAIVIRRVRKNDVPKWSNQPADFDMGNILYNYDNVLNKKRIVICEGITDVWAFHEIGIPAVATFGAHITKNQYKLLLKTGADLVLAFDGDKAGRKATEKALKLFENKANVEVLQLDEGQDPENISREELFKRYERRKKA